MAYAELGLETERAKATQRTQECVERHIGLHPDDARALTFGAYALVEQGEVERAKKWSERALEADLNETAVIYNVACTYSLLGETDKAIELLGNSIAQCYGHRAWLEHDSDLAPLRDDSRF